MAITAITAVDALPNLGMKMLRITVTSDAGADTIEMADYGMTEVAVVLTCDANAKVLDAGQLNSATGSVITLGAGATYDLIVIGA